MAKDMADKERAHKELLMQIEHENRIEREDAHLQKQLLLGQHDNQLKEIHRLQGDLHKAGLLKEEYSDSIKEQYFTNDGNDILGTIGSLSATDLSVSLDEIERTGSSIADLESLIDKNTIVLSGLNRMINDKAEGEAFAQDYYDQAREDYFIESEELKHDNVLKAFENKYRDEISSTSDSGVTTTTKHWNTKFHSAMNALNLMDRDQANLDLTTLLDTYGENYNKHTYDERLDINNDNYNPVLADKIKKQEAAKHQELVIKGKKALKEDADNAIKVRLKVLIEPFKALKNNDESNSWFVDNVGTDTGIDGVLNTFEEYEGELSLDIFKDKEMVAKLKNKISGDFLELVDRSEGAGYLYGQQTYDEVEQLLHDAKNKSGEYGVGAAELLLKQSTGKDQAGEVGFKEYVTGELYDGKYYEKTFNPASWWGNLPAEAHEHMLNLARMYYHLEDTELLYNSIETEGLGDAMAYKYAHDGIVNVASFTSEYLENLTASAKQQLDTSYQNFGYGSSYIQGIILEAQDRARNQGEAQDIEKQERLEQLKSGEIMTRIPGPDATMDERLAFTQGLLKRFDDIKRNEGGDEEVLEYDEKILEAFGGDENPSLLLNEETLMQIAEQLKNSKK